MSKGLKITGIIIGVILILMILIPLLFKGKIEEIVKAQANKNLNATLNFESVGLNLFSSFPNLSLSIDELSVINKEPFEGDTLIYISTFQTSVDLWSVIFGDKIKIKSISLKEPNIFVYVLEDSTANYNITKKTAEVEDTAKSQMNIALDSYSIEDGNIAYIDQTSGMMVAIKNLDHSGSADFTKDVFTINTETDIESFTFESGGTAFLKNVKTSLDLELEADMPNKKFTLKDNSLQLNNLLLKFAGIIDMKDTANINMDLKFNTVRTDFKDFISLIPAVYTKDFDDIKSSGKLALDGYAKGIYGKETLPSFGLNIKVDNGNFRYPKLPTPVNNVNMDLTVQNPGGSKDNTEINLKKFHVEIGSDPLDATLVMKTPVSNPYVDAMMKGRINLSNVKNAVKLEDVTKLNGMITADFKAKGNLGNAEKRQIEKLDANGVIAVFDIVYQSTTLPQEINIKKGTLSLTPQRFNLSNMGITFGKSDIQASGSLTNVLSYVLTDGILNGNLNLSSGYLDVNPFILENPKEEVKQPESKKEAVVLPERINFTMNSNFKTIIYDNLTLNNVKGVITLADQRLNLKNLSMNLLDGTLAATGYYQASSETDQSASFNMEINNFSIGKTYESFVTVKQFAPMAKYMHGNFDAKMNMSTPLGSDMMPEWNQFNGSGTLNLERAEVKNFKPFEEVGNLLKINELKNPVLTNVKPSFKIVNGRFYISPFTYKVMNYNVTFSGSNGIDKTIDYTMNVEIPAENLKNQANQAISKIFKRDVDLITANKVNVKAMLSGNIESPKVSASGGDILKETTQSVQAEVKQELQKEIDKQKEQASKEITKKVDTLKNTMKKEVENKLKDLFKKKK